MPQIECDRCKKVIPTNEALAHKLLTNHKLYVICKIMGSRRELTTIGGES